MKLIKYFRIICIATLSLVLQREVCAALATTAWYTPIAKSVRMYASSYKTWRMVHPRLATSSDVLVLAGALIWVLNHFIKPVNSHPQQVFFHNVRDSEEPSFYPDGQKSDAPNLAPDIPEDGDSSDEELTRRVFNPPSL